MRSDVRMMLSAPFSRNAALLGSRTQPSGRYRKPQASMSASQHYSERYMVQRGISDVLEAKQGRSTEKLSFKESFEATES